MSRVPTLRARLPRVGPQSSPLAPVMARASRGVDASADANADASDAPDDAPDATSPHVDAAVGADHVAPTAAITPQAQYTPHR